MYIKIATLFTKLIPMLKQQNKLINMANEVLDDRFLPIKLYDVKMKWMGLLVWDNEKEILHGPFNAKGGISGSHLYLEDYKWAGFNLFLYFSDNTDYCITGLRSGSVNFEEV